MTSANPANPLTRAEFYNACTSVLQGLTCLQRQGAIVNDEAIETLDKLGLMVSDLRSDVQTNREFIVDGPLVRFLTAQVLKGKSVIQEMKRTCSQQSSVVNGPEFVERHLHQHISDIKAVIKELTPYHNSQLYSQHTQNVDREIQERLVQDPRTVDTTLTPILKNGQTQSARKSAQIHFDGTGDMTGTHAMKPAVNSISSPLENLGHARISALRAPRSLPQHCNNPSQNKNISNHSAMSTSETLSPGQAVPSTGDSKTPGVFEHISEETNIYPEHSPNWPKHEENLPSLLERTRPPLVYNGLRDMQNYTNLPQYSGVNLPMPVMPDGEFGHRAPHTQHWDYHNNRMY